MVDGTPLEITKDPVTDTGTKKSHKGLLAVNINSDTGELEVKQQCTWAETEQGCLRTVFIDGRLTQETTLADIRERM